MRSRRSADACCLRLEAMTCKSWNEQRFCRYEPAVPMPGIDVRSSSPATYSRQHVMGARLQVLCNPSTLCARKVVALHSA